MSNVRVPDLNHVIIAGRLTRDPELKYLTSGRAVCEFSVANTQYFKGKDGERRESTSFVNVTCWDKYAEYVGEKIKKGRPVIVEGRLKSDTWEDKSTGQKRSRLFITASRVTALDWDDDQGGDSSGGYRKERDDRPKPREIEEPIADDDIPF